MIKVSYCCHEEISCTCKMDEYSFISHTPCDIVIFPDDCEVNANIEVKINRFRRIHGCVIGKYGAPLSNFLVKLFKECWKYGSRILEEISINLTDEYGLYEFILPCNLKEQNYKVIISNTSFDECASKGCNCDCKSENQCCNSHKEKPACNHGENPPYKNTKNRRSSTCSNNSKDAMTTSYKYYNKTYYNS